MYGVLKKRVTTPEVQKNNESQVKPCPKCNEDFVKMHAYAFSPFSLRSGPKPWTDRKDDNF